MLYIAEMYSQTLQDSMNAIRSWVLKAECWQRVCTKTKKPRNQRWPVSGFADSVLFAGSINYFTQG